MQNNQQSQSHEKLIPEKGCCDFCSIETNGLYPYQDGDIKKRYCVLCMEQNTSMFVSNGFVGYFGVTNNTRECFSLLKLAIIRALNSNNQIQVDKANLILKKLRESYPIILETYGSIQKEDLKKQLTEQPNLVLIDSDKSIIQHLINHTDNELSDFTQWEIMYNSHKSTEKEQREE